MIASNFRILHRRSRGYALVALIPYSLLYHMYITPVTFSCLHSRSMVSGG